MNVNIYIETSYRGPAVRRAVGAWIVECITSDGVPNTRGGLIYADRIGENDLTLCLIEKAFSILNKMCCVVVFTECGHVLRTMIDHHITEWTDQWHTYRLEMQRRIRVEMELEHAADYEEIVVEEWNTPKRRKEREDYV